MANDEAAIHDPRARRSEKGQTVSFNAGGEWRTLRSTRRGSRYVIVPMDAQDEAALDLHGFELVGTQEA